MNNYYDEKSKSLTLVTGLKGEELETETYQYPFFVKGIYTKKAIDLGAELEENKFTVPGDLFDRITSFIVELYNKQFSHEKLIDGIDSRKIIETYISVLMGVLQGDTSKKE
ncbi:hypothetical protein JUJ52_02655 [Virgibacillus sp. AGTR]|uniref:phage tail assembly chaperone G n=1 Tax=Virgibacillus sp. AGTR TaxID=2812055 RepID=UPI001D16B30A|nr:hypothetical protein [Virgibacillus sp. AGTR]MCC2248860.1 hypothetical protein [Virgibacillus sp. AGTR]